MVENCEHRWVDDYGCPGRCDGPQEIGAYCRLHAGFHGEAMLAKVEKLTQSNARWKELAEALDERDTKMHQLGNWRGYKIACKRLRAAHKAIADANEE